MNIKFLDSKEGTKTFCVNSIYYHSSYSPVKEAEKFVNSLSIPYKPKLLFIIEPGFSYTTTFLQNKYPDTKLVAIRLLDYNFPDDNQWDYSFAFNSQSFFSNKLLSNFSEDDLICSSILLWKPNENLFAQKINEIYEAYKNILERCKTLLVTRQYFEKKWLINSIKYFSNLQNIASIKNKLNVPVVICASGPSLKPCLDVIYKNKDKLFIIGLSSAVNVLLNNDITPDLILTTDGGYWAGEHLKRISNTIIACPSEAYIPSYLFNKNSFLPLLYCDGISSILTKESGLKTFIAERNGTVSGTALRFAQELTDNDIYLCGLDLHSQKGFQHTQPNQLEINNSLKDYKIKSKQTRCVPGTFLNDSLLIYEEWFKNAGNVSSVKRVIDLDYKQNDLGNIKDITSKDFLSQVNCIKETKSTDYFYFSKYNNKSDVMKNRLINLLNDEKYQRQLFPADFLSFEMSLSPENKLIIQNRINEKLEKLLLKIKKF